MRVVRWPRLAGSLLVLVGVVGFVTVADDLRHVGEILGVASVLLTGLLLLAAGLAKSTPRRVATYWLAGAVGVGAMAGAAMNNMPVGVGGGLTIGAIAAAVIGRRRERLSQ